MSIVTVVLVCLGIAAGAYFASEGERHSAAVEASERVTHKVDAESDGPASGTKVEIAKPRRGGIERTTTQPGSVMSFESARLFAKVSGYLKEQSLKGQPVDIGTRVKKGDLLAVIDMPELEKEVQRDEALVAQADAQIVQAQAHIESTKADFDAATALIKEREADVEHAESTLSYREKQYVRIEQLVKDKSVEPRLLDEAEEHRDAARAGLSSAKAGVVSAKAMATAAHAKIDQAEADLVDARAKLQVAKATMEKDRVFLDYTQIHSPYNGVVTFRGFFPGEFINARDQGGATPLLSVDRTDKVRVVLQVPDSDVPFVNPGDDAVVEIDALPGRKFKGTVSRISNSEDPQTRTMRTEVDLENDKNLLRDGMYGKVTIFLERAPDALSVPSSALVGESESGKGTIYVVRSGKAHKVEVSIGADDGIHTEIISGLKPDEDVVTKVIRGAISNGASVAVVAGK